MPDNGQKQGELRKKCPFMDGAWCIGDACAIYIQVTQTRIGPLGFREQFQSGMCSLPALCLIISSQHQVQPVKLPPSLFNKG